jgi:transposase
MGKRIYIVRLSREERIGLQKLVKTGKVASFKRHRAQILLNVDQGDTGPCLKNTDVARELDIGIKTVERACKKLVEVGLPTCLERVPRQSTPRKMDGEREAQLISLCFCDSPEGTHRWTLRLLASRFVELSELDSISPETVRQVLKKHYQTLAA